MKILYHHRTLADGAEGIHIEEMVRAFRGLGHEVHVVGLAASNEAATRRTWISRVRAVLPSLLFEAASMAGNIVEYFEVRRAIRDIAPAFLYKRHARNDVGALWAARRAGVPSVLEVNCLFTGQGYREFEPLALEPMAVRLERRAMRLATLRLAVSSPLARLIESLSGVAAVVMPNGADPARFDPSGARPSTVRSRYGLGDAFVIGWTGVLREWHGLELLLDAVSHVAEARLLIVGDGPARGAIQSRAETLGLGDRVIITGRVPHIDVPDHVAAMDVAVVAHDRTGVASPMKLLEYMAMAKAVVAPQLENVRDVVEPGRTGLLFPPGDAEGLTAALQQLAADAGLRASLGRNARETIETARNWRRNAERVLALLPAS
jgi:glycosyltransferase involved in cell wall biosynthesis